MQTITRTPAMPAAIVPDVMRTASYDVTSTSGNQIHDIPGRADPEVTLRVAGTRAGTIAFTFTTKPAAFTAAASHREVGIFTLVDTDVPEMGMSYVVTGTVRLYLDPETLTAWHLEIGFREVVL
jgi:hypothetical protein